MVKSSQIIDYGYGICPSCGQTTTCLVPNKESTCGCGTSLEEYVMITSLNLHEFKEKFPEHVSPYDGQ